MTARQAKIDAWQILANKAKEHVSHPNLKMAMAWEKVSDELSKKVKNLQKTEDRAQAKKKPKGYR